MQFIKHTAAVFCFFVAMACCGCGQTKFEWSACISSPQYYGAAGPSITYYYNGKSVSGTSSLSGNAQGWGIGGDCNSNDFAKTEIPDLIDVHWICDAEGYEYLGHFALPRAKMLALFKKGYYDSAAKETIPYNGIQAGMAPGGHVTVWMQATGHLTEVARFKASNLGIYKEHDAHYQNYVKEHNESAGAKAQQEYIKHHGIPYAAWEQEEPAYPWGVGFISEDGEMQFSGATFFSADGTVLNHQNEIEFAPQAWNKPYGQPIVLRTESSQTLNAKLPVHVRIQWGAGGFGNDMDLQREYNTQVPLPKDYAKRFFRTYINPLTDKPANYRRIVFGVQKGGSECIVWLDGPGKQEELMRFKAARVADLPDNELTALPSGYALPINK